MDGWMEVKDRMAEESFLKMWREMQRKSDVFFMRSRVTDMREEGRRQVEG